MNPNIFLASAAVGASLTLFLIATSAIPVWVGAAYLLTLAVPIILN